MKVDLNLLAALLSQAKEYSSVPRDGVNDYLLDNILFPCLNGGDIRLEDINFDAFAIEDVEALSNHHDRMCGLKAAVDRLAQSVDGIRPAAGNTRAYC